MSPRKFKINLAFLLCISLLIVACSTKKNTSTTRLYHSINTKYNVYFNAEEAYKEALKSKEEAHQDTLTQILDVYPTYKPRSLSDDNNNSGGAFGKPIDKTTKAIKVHSIKSKPERDPSKKRDPKYQEWLKQQEFNPFLKNAWLLLGKSEYQDDDYLQAASTFAYIVRLYKNDPEVVAEARLWLARANIALGWYYEAEDIFNQIRLAGGVPESLKYDYDKLYADFLIKQKEYFKAIPFLEDAISKEGGGLQKTRMRYILGQLYKKVGDREKAYLAFDNVQGLSVPYLYSFNAQIEKASFVDDVNKKQILSLLDKMLKDHKNKDYLDQIYYAIGNIYLNDQDTTKAILNYKKSLEESTRNGYDKALTDVTLGNIYFTQKKYVEAQPVYSDALGLLSKSNENYPLVALRSEVLDELVVHAKAVQLQDSLQTMARMPEAERMIVINKIIEDLKKKEAEERKRAERENRINENSQNTNSLFDQKDLNIPINPLSPGEKASFYFYNPQTVTQGKAFFKRKWGTRTLEDDWRRKNKHSLSFAESGIPEEIVDTIDIESSNQAQNKLGNDTITDVYSPGFYLQQLPLTPQAIDESNKTIENALFNMGKIYKDKLGDYRLSIDAFETDLKRFPYTPNKEEIYYQLFLIYLRLGNALLTEQYRSKILQEFPQSSYATALSDADYALNMLNMHQIEDNLYQNTYEYYLNGATNEVRENYDTMIRKYPLSNLMPKFKFLNALTYAQTNNPEEFKSNLKELIESYPQSDVTPLATEMLKGLIAGKQLSSDDSPFRGMIWDIKFGNGDSDLSSGFDFIANPESEFLYLLVFEPSKIDKNQLIYEVANYNFSNFVYQTFDLSFSSQSSIDMLQIKGFKDFNDILLYSNLALASNSLISHISPSIVPIPISVDNYIALLNGKTLNEYFSFFEQNYAKEMPNLITYWNRQRDHSLETDSIKSEKISPNEVIEPKEKEDKDSVSKEQNIPTVTKPEQSQAIPNSSLLPDAEQIKKDSAQDGVGFEDIMSDDQIDKADQVINKTLDIISNPVDGLKDLFKKSSPEEKSANKEEKEKIKAENRIRKEQEKEKKAEENAKLKLIQEEEKVRQDSIKNEEREKIEEQRAQEKTKVEEQKAVQKAKEDARKQRQLELKEKEKARKEELARKEKEREDRLKQKEKERKERLKQREQELKEKERQAKQKSR